MNTSSRLINLKAMGTVWTGETESYNGKRQMGEI